MQYHASGFLIGLFKVRYKFHKIICHVMLAQLQQQQKKDSTDLEYEIALAHTCQMNKIQHLHTIFESIGSQIKWDI